MAVPYRNIPRGTVLPQCRITDHAPSCFFLDIIGSNEECENYIFLQDALDSLPESLSVGDIIEVRALGTDFAFGIATTEVEFVCKKICIVEQCGC